MPESQSSTSSLLPGQADVFPTSLRQSLVRDCVPTAQVAEQGVKSDHSDHVGHSAPESQRMVSNSGPVQSLSSGQVRVLVFCPSPHVTEQSDQGAHSAHWSTSHFVAQSSSSHLFTRTEGPRQDP